MKSWNISYLTTFGSLCYSYYSLNCCHFVIYPLLLGWSPSCSSLSCSCPVQAVIKTAARELNQNMSHLSSELCNGSHSSKSSPLPIPLYRYGPLWSFWYYYSLSISFTLFSNIGQLGLLWTCWAHASLGLGICCPGFLLLQHFPSRYLHDFHLTCYMFLLFTGYSLCIFFPLKFKFHDYRSFGLFWIPSV